MDEQNPTTEFTRKEVNKAAERIAATLRRFVEDADQFLSFPLRSKLLGQAHDLEDFANHGH